jgi:hypothetical protein
MCDWNWNAIVGIGTMALAVIAFGSFWLQFYFSKQQGSDSRAAVDRTVAAQLSAAREENKIRLYLDMRERWDGERLEQARRALAGLFKNTTASQRTDQFFEQMIERVPNFFEDLGSMLRHELLDEQLIYDLFSYHVKGWYVVCEPYFVWLRGKKKDYSLFEDFKALYERMMDLEAKERELPRNQIKLSDAEVREFLEEELLV